MLDFLRLPCDARDADLLVNVLELEVFLMVSQWHSSGYFLFFHLALSVLSLGSLVLHWWVHLGLDVQEQHRLLSAHCLISPLHALVVAKTVDSDRDHSVVVHLLMHHFVLLRPLRVRMYLA